MARKPQRKPKQLIRVTEAADILSVARSTVMYRAAKGIYTSKEIGGVTFLDRKEIERAAAQQAAA